MNTMKAILCCAFFTISAFGAGCAAGGPEDESEQQSAARPDDESVPEETPEAKSAVESFWTCDGSICCNDELKCCAWSPSFGWLCN